MVSQLSCGEELWVTTHNLLLSITLGVGEVNIIAQDFKKTLGSIHTAHDGTHLVDTALGGWVSVAHLLPSIIVFVGRIGRA